MRINILTENDKVEQVREAWVRCIQMNMQEGQFGTMKDS